MAPAWLTNLHVKLPSELFGLFFAHVTGGVYGALEGRFYETFGSH
jgi:hypothetical protein